MQSPRPTRTAPLHWRMRSGGSNLPVLIRTDIAYQIGSLTGSNRQDRRKRAAILKMAGRGSVRARAEAFGWLAVSVAPRSPRRGVELIDRALNCRSRIRRDSSTTAARCSRPPGSLPAPGDSGIPTCQTSLPACWPRVGRPASSAPAHRIRSETLAAAALALTDPERRGTSSAPSSRGATSMPARSPGSPASTGSLPGRSWTWTMRSPWSRPSSRPSKAGRDVDLGQTGLLPMAAALAMPTDRREEFLRHVIGGTWYPGFPLLRRQAAGALGSPHSTSPQTFGDWNPAGFGRDLGRHRLAGEGVVAGAELLDLGGVRRREVFFS